jgi:uncharacterized membrane protein
MRSQILRIVALGFLGAIIFIIIGLATGSIGLQKGYLFVIGGLFIIGCSTLLSVVLSRIPQFARLQQLRRIVVFACYVGLALYACSWLFQSIVGPTRIAAEILGFGVLALSIGGAGFVVIMLWMRNTQFALVIDERMIRVRNDAMSVAFQVIAMVCALEAVVWYSRNTMIALPRTVDLTSLFLAIDLVLALTLPAAILAWTEPNPTEEQQKGYVARDIDGLRSNGM